jgi:hypothetical protein
MEAITKVMEAKVMQRLAPPPQAWQYCPGIWGSRGSVLLPTKLLTILSGDDPRGART